MKILRIVLIAVISLLGLGAGIAKVMLMPDELAYQQGRLDGDMVGFTRDATASGCNSFYLS